MKKTEQQADPIAKKRKYEYFLFVPVTVILVFLAVNFYTEASFHQDQTEMALYATGYFICGLFVGRYLSQMITISDQKMANRILIILSVLIVAIIIWLLVFAEKSMNKNSVYLKLLFLGLPFLMLSIALGMAIKLVRTTSRKQLYTANFAAEQSQSELKLLQSQLSPHFLFNTLNNIYGISLTQHEKVPALLLQLSSLLRYSVYDVRELFVPLTNEIAYINDYIAFERLRIGDRLALTTAFEQVENPGIKVAPMLLIVFVENAFKHGKNNTSQKIYIDIVLRTWSNSILFSIKNSSNAVADENSILDKHSGFGLDNVTKRLELLYPGQFDLNIQQQDGEYTVLLQLKMK